MKRSPLSIMLHAAAAVLFVVSAVTVFYGAIVLRPNQKAVAVLTAAGSIIALAAIEKRVLSNLVTPTASTFRLLVCMVPFLTLCTVFSAATFFDVHRTELAAQAEREEAWARWQTERPRFSDFQTSAVALLRTAQAQEQAALALPPPMGTAPSDAAMLRRQRRARIAILIAADRIASQMPQLPLTPPDANVADAALLDVYSWAQRVAIAIPSDLTPQLRVPAPEARRPQADDVLSVLLRETTSRSPTAVFAWGAAVSVESLPFLCLLAATPSVSFAARIHRGRVRLAAIRPAFTEPIGRIEVPFRVAGDDMTGVVTLHGNVSHLHVADFVMALRAMYPAFGEKTGRDVSDVHVIDSAGEVVNANTPLGVVLSSGPLVLQLT